MVILNKEGEVNKMKTIINHEKLGNIELVVQEDSIFLKIEGEKIMSDLYRRNNEIALRFSNVITVKGSKVGGLKISENEYEEIEKIQNMLKTERKEKELDDFMSKETVTFHSSYGFIGVDEQQYSLKIQRATEKNLEDKAIDFDYGDYSIMTTFAVSGKKLIEMLEIEKNRSEAIKMEASKKKEEEKKSIFNKARETGKKQLLKKWSEECNDDNEECNLDMIYVYAMPDGSEKIERYHTW